MLDCSVVVPAMCILRVCAPAGPTSASSAAARLTAAVPRKRRRVYWPGMSLLLALDRWVAAGRCSCDPERPAGRAVAVGGQERGQRRQHLLGSLLGDPVAGAGDDHALHVVRGGLHPVPDLFTPAFRSADRQDGHPKRPVLALRVLCQGRIERSVEPEAATQGVGVGEETDVVVDHVLWQLLPALDGELVAEEDIFASPDELFG